MIGAYNRLLSDGTYRYEYDGEGNRIRRYIDDDQSGTFNTGDTDVTEYTWDYRNRLSTVKNYAAFGGSVTEQVDFAYDADNQLVNRTVDPDGAMGSAAVEQTVFIHEQGQVVLQFDKAGSGSLAVGDLSHRYLWGPVVDQLFTDEQVESLTNASLNETLWALTDRQGSVTDLVDSEATLRLHRVFDSFGNIVDETHYDASGNVVTEGQTGYLDAAFAYTWRLLDSATGLQNNLNRWYDASIGRWLSEDPIGFAAGDANLYRYVGNGPVRFTDPTGRWPYGMGGPEDPPFFYDPRDGIRHDPDFPKEVPQDWDKPKLDQEIEEWEDSIGGREWEQDRRPEGDNKGHRDRIRREKEWLEKLRERRREITACVIGAGAGAAAWRGLGRAALSCVTIPFRIFVMPVLGDPNDPA